MGQQSKVQVYTFELLYSCNTVLHNLVTENTTYTKKLCLIWASGNQKNRCTQVVCVESVCQYKSLGNVKLQTLFGMSVFPKASSFRWILLKCFALGQGVSSNQMP